MTSINCGSHSNGNTLGGDQAPEIFFASALDGNETTLASEGCAPGSHTLHVYEDAAFDVVH